MSHRDSRISRTCWGWTSVPKKCSLSTMVRRCFAGLAGAGAGASSSSELSAMARRCFAGLAGAGASSSSELSAMARRCFAGLALTGAASGSNGGASSAARRRAGFDAGLADGFLAADGFFGGRAGSDSESSPTRHPTRC